MSYKDNSIRQRIIRQALNARTEEEVAAAIQQLDQWRKDHPDDQSIRDAYEPLMLRQTAFRQLAASLAPVK